MVRILLVRAVAATPKEVADAYRRSVENEGGDDPAASTRRIVSADPDRLRFVTRGKARAGDVRVDGIVAWEGEDAWSCRREVEVNGRPYSWDIERYHVRSRDGGTVLTVDCEVHARGDLQEVLLAFGRRRLLVERAKALDRWLPGPAFPG